MHFEDPKVKEWAVNSSELAAGGCAKTSDQTPGLNKHCQNPSVTALSGEKRSPESHRAWRLDRQLSRLS